MLDHLAAVDSEDVNMRTSPLGWRGDHVRVDDHVIAVNEHAAHIDSRLRVASRPLHEFAQSVNSIRCISTMLDVDVTQVRRSGDEIAAPHHRVVEGEYQLPVVLLSHSTTSARTW